MRLLNIFSKIAFIWVFVLSAVTLRASMLPEDWPAMGRFPSAVKATSAPARAFVEALKASDDFIRNPEKHLNVWPHIMGKERVAPVDILNFMTELQIALTSLDPLTPALAEGMGRLVTGLAQHTSAEDEVQALLSGAYLVGQSGENLEPTMALLHQHWQEATGVSAGNYNYQRLAWAMGTGAQLLNGNDVWYADAEPNVNALLEALNNRVNSAVDVLLNQTDAKANGQAPARWISYRADRIARAFPPYPNFHAPTFRAILRQFGPQMGQYVIYLIADLRSVTAARLHAPNFRAILRQFGPQMGYYNVGHLITVLGKVPDERLKDATFQELVKQVGPQMGDNVGYLITALMDAPDERLQDTTFQAMLRQFGPQMRCNVGYLIYALMDDPDERLQDSTFQAMLRQFGPQMGNNVDHLIYALGGVPDERLQDSTFQAMLGQFGRQMENNVDHLIKALGDVTDERLQDATFQRLVQQFGPQVGRDVFRLIGALRDVPPELLNDATFQRLVQQVGPQVGRDVFRLIGALRDVPPELLNDATFQALVQQVGPQVGEYVGLLIGSLGDVPLHLLPPLSESIIGHGGAQAFFQRVPVGDFSTNLTARRFSATSTAAEMTAFMDEQWDRYAAPAAPAAASTE